MARYCGLFAGLVGPLWGCGYVPTHTYIYHADIQFTTTERASIDAAADSWAQWSQGRQHIRVQYDYVSYPHPDTRPKNLRVIIRGNEYSKWDAGVPLVADGEQLAGYCIGTYIVLVLPNWVTAAHEIGHSLGIRHIATPGGIMSPVTLQGHSRWLYADVTECRRAKKCE